MFILWKVHCVVIECRTESEWWLTEKEAKWAWHSGRRAIHNVLITLSLWIKSFTFMVLWVGLNTFGYSIDDWSSKVELDLRLLRRSWFSTSAIWRQTTSVLHQHLDRVELLWIGRKLCCSDYLRSVDFMLFQNVERFRSHQEKEKIPEEICHRHIEVNPQRPVTTR